MIYIITNRLFFIKKEYSREDTKKEINCLCAKFVEKIKLRKSSLFFLKKIVNLICKWGCNTLRVLKITKDFFKF